MMSARREASDAIATKEIAAAFRKHGQPAIDTAELQLIAAPAGHDAIVAGWVGALANSSKMEKLGVYYLRTTINNVF
jgi:hypothetical protein